VAVCFAKVDNEIVAFFVSRTLERGTMMLRILAPGLEVIKAMRHTLVEAARAKLIAAKDPTIKVRRLRERLIDPPALAAHGTPTNEIAGLDIRPDFVATPPARTGANRLNAYVGSWPFCDLDHSLFGRCSR
jgi:hypothetical protein